MLIPIETIRKHCVDVAGIGAQLAAVQLRTDGTIATRWLDPRWSNYSFREAVIGWADIAPGVPMPTVCVPAGPHHVGFR